MHFSAWAGARRNISTLFGFCFFGGIATGPARHARASLDNIATELTAGDTTSAEVTARDTASAEVTARDTASSNATARDMPATFGIAATLDADVPGAAAQDTVAAVDQQSVIISERNFDTALDQLPAEILLCISDYMDIADVACMSMCSHLLQQKIGQNCLERFGFDPNSEHGTQDRQDLLLRICRDDDRHYFSLERGYILPNDALAPPLWGPRSSSWRNFKGILYHIVEIHRSHPSRYRLTFDHVQCVMARHRRGRG